MNEWRTREGYRMASEVLAMSDAELRELVEVVRIGLRSTKVSLAMRAKLERWLKQSVPPPSRA